MDSPSSYVQASLNSLNKNYCIPNGRTVEMLAFRPNIVVSGGGVKAWDEDYWRTLEISRTDGSVSSGTPGLRFAASKPCARCVLTTVIPGKGTRHTTGEPLASLRAHRKILSDQRVEVETNARCGNEHSCWDRAQLEIRSLADEVNADEAERIEYPS